VVVFILAALVSLPAAVIAGFLLTPLLWKLEPVLGMELAGHSGPSDWLLLTLSATLTVGITALYVWITRHSARVIVESDPLV
jgi:hypothetical protein